MKILIDNGHGRETVGKRSPDGRLLEWSYNREIAARVVAALQMQGFYASLLVPEDEDVSLDERCQRVATFAARSPITAKPRHSIWNVGAYFSPINSNLSVRNTITDV